MRRAQFNRQSRQNAVSATVLLVGVFLAARSECRAGDLPADLDAVPRDAVGFVHVRAADLWRSDWAKDIRFFVDNAGPEAWKAFEKKCPINPATLDRITLLYLTPQTLNDPFPTVDPEATSALVLVTTSKPFDRVALIQALGPKEKVYRHNLYYFGEEMWSGLAVLDDRTFLIGSEDSLVKYFDMARRKTQTGPLQGPLAEAAGKHHVVVGLNPKLVDKADGGGPIPPPLQKLLEANAAAFALDLDDGIRLHARLDYLGDDQARDGETAVRQTLEMGRQGLAQPMAELEKLLNTPGKASAGDLAQHFASLAALGFLRELDTLLKEAPVERKGSTVKVPLTYKKLAGTQLYAYSILFLGAVNTRFAFGGKSNQKDTGEANLRMLAKAMEQYREKHGSYPPAAIYDREGRPTLSWRVALLPFLGEEALYKSFNLNEPWDSLHNKRLLKRMPKVLQVANDEYRYWGGPRWKTTSQVFAGVNTVFDGPKGVRQADVARPAVLVAHVASEAEVYWTKPADVSYAADKPLPDFHGKYAAPIHVLLTDGTYRAIERSMDEKAVRGLIERGGTKPTRIDRPAPPGDLQAIWNDFTQNDDAGTRKAWQGIIAMSKSPERAVPFVKARVKPVPAPDAKRIAQWLADLDSNNFQKRAKAAAELEGLGELAQAAIDKMLAEKAPSLEVRRRLEGLAQKKTRSVLSAEELRSLRAVAVLEEAGTPDARAVLGDLARGGDGAVLTEQARLALARLAQRSGGRSGKER